MRERTSEIWQLKCQKRAGPGQEKPWTQQPSNSNNNNDNSVKSKANKVSFSHRVTSQSAMSRCLRRRSALDTELFRSFAEIDYATLATRAASRRSGLDCRTSAPRSRSPPGWFVFVSGFSLSGWDPKCLENLFERKRNREKEEGEDDVQLESIDQVNIGDIWCQEIGGGRLGSLPGSKKTIALRQAKSWSFIWMSLKGLTIRSSTIPATLLISLSGVLRDTIAPLPKMRVSVHRIERRAAPKIKFSPACVFNKAI